jgi:uncharacterized membrane protein
MNNAHFHLVVNHLPIVGILIGTLTLISGLLMKKSEVKLTAYGTLLFSAISSILAFLTGEGAEELVGNLSGISETLIHAHEEYAEAFLTLTLILGVLSLIASIAELKSFKFSKQLLIIVLLTSISALVLAKYVGTSGGEIRHSEIRNNGKITHLEQYDD